jgi:ParB/RepB/Spo0J family partition protein
MSPTGSPQSEGLAELSPKEIYKNPHNPRLIFKEESMRLLKESIREVGILVPLIVYKGKSDGKYYLLDGERRWRCALELGLEKVPANIIPEPTETSNILTMFNIHNVREAWEPMPTALKLEVLMRLLNVRSDQKLAALTGLKVGTIRSLKKLLAYDKKYQDMMILATGEDKVKTNFFVELYPVFSAIEKYLPQIHRKYTRNDIIDRLIEKYRNNVITDVIDFRQLTSMIRAIDKGAPQQKVQELVIRVIEDPKFSIRDAYDLSARAIYDVLQMRKTCKALRDSLIETKIEALAEDSDLLQLLKEIREKIERILDEVTRMKKKK